MAGNLTAGQPTAVLIERGVGTPGVAMSSVALTRAAGTTYDVSSWTAGSQPGLYTKATTFGSVSLNVDTDTLSYVLDDNLPRSQLLATGDRTTDAVNVQLTDGSAAAVSFAIEGTNDAPTIRAASGGETGSLIAADPDRGTTVIWSVDGGTTTITTQPFEFAIDSLQVTKNGSLLFQDDFTDGAAPPSAPNFPNGNPGAYFTLGGLTEVDGRAIMDSDAAARLSGINTLNPLAGVLATLDTGIGPDLSRGLRDTSTFDVTGTFDLVRPDFARQLYGVRLIDSTPTNPSNDIIEFVVRAGADGQPRVALRQLDAQLNTTTQLGASPVLTDFGPGDQIRLRLFHEPAPEGAPQVVRAAYQIIRDGVAEPTVTFSAVAPIFRGENFTRAQFIGMSPQDTESVLSGTYGTLSINENGAYTFTPNEAGSTLGAGQRVSERFTIVATDERGERATHEVVINLTGNGTGDPDTTLATTGKVVDGYVAGATVFADANRNGVLDAGEASTTTDATGTFALVGGTGPIVAVGGVDTATGLDFAGRLSAPQGSTVVTPLTTLIVALGSTPEAAGRLNAALGISSNVDLTAFDPVAATVSGRESATAAFVAGVSVQNTVVSIASALGDAGSVGTIDSVYAAIAARIAAGEALDLTSAGTVQELLADTAARTNQTVDAGFAARAGGLIATGNAAVATQASGTGEGVISAVATLAFAVQSSLADALERAKGDPALLQTTDLLLQTRSFTGGTVEQTGAFRQYLTRLLDGDGTISGIDGLQALTDVRQVTYLDGRLVFDAADPLAVVYRLYEAALDRAPDSAGLNYWAAQLENGTSLETVAGGFALSPEFQARYGALSDRSLVEQLYRNVLDRAGEAEGVASWTSALASGAQTRAGVLVGFSESAEHVAKLLPAVQAGLWDQNEAASSVARLYYAALDRAPDAGGLTSWVQALESGRPLAEIGDGFASSAEFQNRYGTLANEEFVRQLYANVLDREADVVGLAFWTGELEAGRLDRGDVLLGFSEAPEFQIKAQPLIEGGILLA